MQGEQSSDKCDSNRSRQEELGPHAALITGDFKDAQNSDQKGPGTQHKNTASQS
jgi:hypothetical protein